MVTIDELLVLFGGAVSMLFVYWYFLMKNEEIVKVVNDIEIFVNGGYKPDVIQIPVNKKTTLNFKRTDPSSCLEEIVLSDFRIKKYLPLNKKISIELNPKEKGEFNFSCGMNMFHGKLIVV